MARKSIYDVRSVDPKIIDIILEELILNKGIADFRIIDQVINEKRLEGYIDSRTTRKATSSTDEIVQLTWFGIIELTDDTIHSKVKIEDLILMRNDLIGNLTKLYYEEEILYRLFIDFLNKKGRSTDEEILTHLEGKIIDIQSYPTYRLENSESVVRFNKAKLSYLKRVGKKLGTIRIIKEGNRSVIILQKNSGDLRIEILRSYENISSNLTFIKLSDLYKELKKKNVRITEEAFNKAILNLRDQFFPAIDLFQSSGDFAIFDPALGKYYHSIRIDRSDIGNIKESIMEER